MIPKKTERANLENKRTIFLEIGLVISLTFVLLAFNWKTYDKEVLMYYSGEVESSPVEMVPVTVQKPPELPQVRKPLEIHKINIVDNETAVEDDYIVSAEIDQMDTVPEYMPVPALKEEEEDISQEEIFQVVESMPQFPGGEAALYAFLAENTKYPRMAIEAGISGRGYVTFVVEKDGSITDIKLVRGIGGGCDEEAIRVVQSMPQWTPGKQRNMPVRVQFIMNVKFTLGQM